MVLHDYQDILRGCTDFTAINYNSNAEIDEGCWYMDIVEMDSSLVTEPLNFSTGSGDIELTIDNGTIIYMNDSPSSGSIEIYIIETPAWAWNGDLLPDSTEFARDIVTFYPIELSFSEPVDISLSYSSTGNNFRLMMLEDSEDDSWEEVEGAVCSIDEFGEGICESGVLSFGIFGVQEIPLSTFMENTMPETFTLHQNYPNPFNPITNLRYDLPEQAEITLTIYDMMGREVSQLINTTQEAGFKSIQWDATDNMGKPVSAGVYLYQIKAGEFVQTRKMVLLK
jgi:hypothetical protein